MQEKVKTAIIKSGGAAVHFLLGYISYYYWYLAYFILTNGKEDGSYSNPEGESIRPLGLIMMLLYVLILFIVNAAFYSKFRRRGLLINTVFYLAGGAASLIYIL